MIHKKKICVLAAIVCSSIAGIQQYSHSLFAERFNVLSQTLHGRVRVAVCISGQVGRLEIHSKMRNLFAQNDDLELHAFLVLDPSEVAYSTTTYKHDLVSNRQVDVKSVLLEAEKAMQPHLKRIFLLNDFSSLGYLKTHDERRTYLEGMPKRDRFIMLQKHVKQFLGHCECARVIAEEEVRNNIRYEAALRIRDNTVVVQPFKIPLDMIRQSPGAYVKNCSDWDGVNDKVMLVSRVYLDPAFRGWINHFMFRRVDESVRVLNNPEKFLDGVLRQEGVPIHKLDVDSFPMVDGRVDHSRKTCLVSHVKDCRPRHDAVDRQYEECVLM